MAETMDLVPELMFQVRRGTYRDIEANYLFLFPKIKHKLRDECFSPLEESLELLSSTFWSYPLPSIN